MEIVNNKELWRRMLGDGKRSLSQGGEVEILFYIIFLPQNPYYYCFSAIFLFKTPFLLDFFYIKLEKVCNPASTVFKKRFSDVIGKVLISYS